MQQDKNKELIDKIFAAQVKDISKALRLMLCGDVTHVAYGFEKNSNWNQDSEHHNPNYVKKLVQEVLPALKAAQKAWENMDVNKLPDFICTTGNDASGSFVQFQFINGVASDLRLYVKVMSNVVVRC
ncbi:hypothetical protein EBT16_13280 [bacterium]|nr:hypothetical protein [bacterium]